MLLPPPFSEVLTLTSDSRQDPQLIARAQYGLAQIAALRGDITEARRLGTDSAAYLKPWAITKPKKLEHG